MNKIPANVVPPAGPCCLVIFGAAGDLTHRLLVPALYNLAAGGLLPDAFAIIGVARREMSNDAFRSDLARALRRFAIRGIDERTAGRLLARATYVNSSISRRRRQHSHQSAVISADRESRARRTARGADSLSKNRSAPILPRRRRSIEGYSGSWKNTRFIALTTTWGKRRCRISWCFGSQTGCSNQSGTAITSTTCRSRWPRRSP